jgi:hypothetical protein
VLLLPELWGLGTRGRAPRRPVARLGAAGLAGVHCLKLARILCVCVYGVRRTARAERTDRHTSKPWGGRKSSLFSRTRTRR